ncbi:BTAD domain-containing putative transcriptional regulator [Actinoplanes sp. Pm04-4]|uniref:BTAD domain-containing putative transcriptional regulator n=1 Tax=Paractinoplanes pyxinae TaxID=2997416 RepID=A0ABT4BIK8_9ACTN|nr:BTAD domain-containing putative transcriptional regulator [Actinoplanes pyxinae]MCY1145423.1 BTAD domain-containing putative transcriptional regulator [Actinoplanes pyxinae]
MQIGVLGPFEIRAADGGLADVPGARLRALLVALALEPGRVVPKATLVDWIWGEQPPADATNSLHRLVSRLRKALPDGVIEGHPAGYRLAVEPDAVDAVRFERLIAEGRAQEAVALWRGSIPREVGSAAFDAAVSRLEELRLSALEDGGAEQIPELTDLVAAHPLRERLAAALMRALAAAGRGSEALQVYQRTREALADELGADPSSELSSLHVALLRGEGGPSPAPERRTNLRAELTSYVGKGDDVEAVRGLVARHRLTTLIGPGGTGKTRLAGETARTLVDELPDGAWLVELAPIGADGDVAQATIAALGLRDAMLGGTPAADLTERLITAVRDREALLILDNCEHVIEAAATFAHRVLGECRGLRILATSREPLGITGEALWQVEPLPSASAVELLRDRASAVRQDLPDDEATMARVCQALDGMPLAIELAAARLRTMTLDQLAHRLDDRFRLLTGGSRTALPHHRTLRAVVDWSWELLTDAERTVLRRLSVFSGGATLEAAERVCEDPDVFELLTSLTEKSLLVTTGDQAPRYRMLGTIYEYAVQRLAEAGETESARQAHLAWFTELAETADPHLRRAEQLEWLAVLAVEHDNLAAAMRGAIAAGDAQAAMRLAAGAGWYWWLAGHKAEGLELLIAATEVPGEVTDEVRAVAYALAVHFVSSGRSVEHRLSEWVHKAYEYCLRSRPSGPWLGIVGALERMERTPHELLSAWEPLLDDADPWVRALARLHLGKSRIILGHSGREADDYLEAALAEYRALGERFGIWFALTELSERTAVRGNLAGACELVEEAIAAVTELGSVEDVIRMRGRQAQMWWMLGEEEASAAALAEAERQAGRVTWQDALGELAWSKAELARWRGDSAGAREHLAVALALLGANAQAMADDQLAYLTEDVGEARAHRTAAYRAMAESGYAPLVAQMLVGVADLALRQGDAARAAQLLAASSRVRGIGYASHPDVARIERETRNRLGDKGFAEAVAEGERADWRQPAEVTLAS